MIFRVKWNKGWATTSNVIIYQLMYKVVVFSPNYIFLVVGGDKAESGAKWK